MSAQQRYEALSSDRNQFLQTAIDASKLTLPYLIKQDEDNGSHKVLVNPYQSVGSKGVVTLASKLMLALLPPQTSFFKLQLDETAFLNEEIEPQVRSELDLSFSKIERTMMEAIAASDDRVVVHQALKHLVVAGNALIFMAKDKLKLYPLNRYVVDRDGLGNVIEIVTKERINKKIIEALVPDLKSIYDKHDETYAGTGQNNQCDVYTHIKRDNNRFIWHQEVYGKIIPKSQGKAPIDTNPWLALRFNTVDNEAYGRGRVEEFIGDLKSLDALSQAIIEGSAAAAKVVFTVAPSSTTKPSTLAKAGNGAIVSGRPDDIGVITVGKQGDFGTAYQMIQTIEKRLAEAFLILQVRNSERTTAEEVRMTQMELEQQLGGLFSLLTVDFLVPYLNRKLSIFQRNGDIPRLPSKLVKPTIVAGVNALGRGQDRESLNMFMQTIAQTMGPEAISKYINPEEVIKRLAASQGIDVLNLVRGMEEVEQGNEQAMDQQKDLELTKQASKFAQLEGQEDQASSEAPELPMQPQQQPEY
jgi:hypothetical protein|tara:strand:+ start:548 stop:2131 length:1584 start_codon:yes stop_codon:yes gene_type:complete